jgi:hypothetical protein
MTSDPKPTPEQLRHARGDLVYRSPETLTEAEKRLLKLAYPSLVPVEPDEGKP